MRVWRQKFARSIPKLGKDRTRTTTQFLTGHSELNSRINKFKPTTRTVPKTCPHCLMEKETMNHFIGQCPKFLVGDWTVVPANVYSKKYIYNINGNKKFIPAGHMINIKCKGNLKVKLFNLYSTCKVCFFNGEKLKKLKIKK